MPETPAYTAAQVRAAEEPLLAAGEPLMQRAAAALAAQVREELATLPAHARVLVLAGAGNNGGDALYAAAELAGAMGSPAGRGSAPAVEFLRTGRAVHEAAFAAAVAAGAVDFDLGHALTGAYDLVVDGMLGTGTSGRPALRGSAREIVAALLPAVRAGGVRVVAVDLPSGLHPDDGTTVDDLVLPAAVTVTFGAVKAGLVRGRGPELAGRVVLADIGLGGELAATAPVAEASVARITR